MKGKWKREDRAVWLRSWKHMETPLWSALGAAGAAAELLIVYLLTPPTLFSLTWLHIGSDHYIQRRDDFLVCKCHPFPTLAEEFQPCFAASETLKKCFWNADTSIGLDTRSKWIMLSDVSKCCFIVIASSPTIFKPNVSRIMLWAAGKAVNPQPHPHPPTLPPI